jgi:hypothetical protein
VAVADQATKADELVDEATDAGGASYPVTVHAKMPRLELLNVKADLERELGQLVLTYRDCGRDVHRVAGLGFSRVTRRIGTGAARRASH